MTRSAGTDLFTRLLNHRVSDALARQEDFLTECLAWLIENDRSVRSALLGAGGYFFRGTLAPLAPPVDSVSVETQVILGEAGRPDMRLSTKDGFALLVENKVGAPFDPGQVLRYIGWAGQGDRALVAAIVPRRSAPSTVPSHPRFIGVYLWEDLALTLSVIEDSGGDPTIRGAFLELLRRLGLVDAPKEPFAWEDGHGDQRVDDVLRLCAGFDRVLATIKKDPSMYASVPPIFRESDGRLPLAAPKPNPVRAGTGPSPRPILAYTAVLSTAVAPIGSLMVSIQFRNYVGEWDDTPPSVLVTANLQRIVGRWMPRANEFLRALVERASGVEPAPELELDLRAERLLAAFERRTAGMLRRVARALEQGGYRPGSVRRDALGASFELVSTAEVLGSPTVPEVALGRFERLLRDVIHCWGRSDPGDPLARLFAETLAPRCVGFGDRGEGDSA
jgi:hypothetical protein